MNRAGNWKNLGRQEGEGRLFFFEKKKQKTFIPFVWRQKRPV
jgi:hypothetical protein